MRAALALLLLTACGSGPARSMRPAEGKAMVVFVRAEASREPAMLWSRGPHLLGVLAPRAHLAVELAPGSHTFMVQGENGSFLDAELEAGRTYFAMVRPERGWSRTRFSLAPIDPGSDEWERLPEYLSSPAAERTTSLTESWAAGQRDRVAMIWQNKR